MTTLLDDLQTPSGGTYLDDLSGPLGTVYTQNADLTVTVSLGATQTAIEFYEQALDINVDVFLGAQQEYVAPDAPAFYEQDGDLSARVFLNSAQEYVTPAGGIFGQQGNIQATVTLSFSQEFIQGTAPGDYLQTADLRAPVTFSFVQVYDPILIASTETAVLGDIGAWLNGTDVTLDASDDFSTVSRITFTLTYSDEVWDATVGPQGGGIAVEVRLGDTPLVSLSPAYPKATFYEGGDSRFETIRAAVLAGPVTLTLGAYEAVTDGADRSLPLNLTGTGQLDMQVVS